MIRTAEIAIIVFLLTACGGGENVVFEAMLDDPMSRPEVSFVEPASHTEVSGSPAGLIGSPKPTLVTTSFELAAQDDVEQALDELLDQAADSGWDVETLYPTLFPQGTFTGSKSTGELSLTLTIIVTGRKILVELR